MKRFIGKKHTFTAKIGKRDGIRYKVCLEGVKSLEGFERDHAWVEQDKRLKFGKGSKIQFTAILYEYIGLEGDKQVKKIGLMNVRNVRRAL